MKNKNSILAKKLQTLFIRKGLSLAVAESCTGGLFSKTITDIPGSSEYFWGGVVCYSNEAKIKILKVKKSTLKKYGAVSKNTALEMVRGILKLSKASIGVSITGIAGPTGGTFEKPVGTIFIGIKNSNGEYIYNLKLKGSRKKIREKTVEFILKTLLKL